MNSWPQVEGGGPIITGSLTPNRRRSSGANSALCTPMSSQSANYAPISGVNSMCSTPRPPSSALICPSPSILFASSQGGNLAPPPPSSQNATKHRRKAVITLDSGTTEILIANDYVSRLFGIRESLIGRRLIEVFSEQTKEEEKENIDDEFGDCTEPPTNKMLHAALFTDNGRMKTVYGKAVDIVDAAGNKSTVSVWSYPLTSHNEHSTRDSETDRKYSMFARTESAVFPSQMTTPHEKLFLNTRLRFERRRLVVVLAWFTRQPLSRTVAVNKFACGFLRRSTGL
uniref:PAS domain-containing protein n=1 Tax=Steinernema glaseri TaxID=37863 RepID=A0A1I7YLR4_9BILA